MENIQKQIKDAQVSFDQTKATVLAPLEVRN